MRYTSNSKMTDAQAQAFGINTYRLRTQAGFKGKDFAELVGISSSYLSNISSTSRSNVSTDIQKTVYRYFSKVKLENEERRLFG